MGYFDDAYFDDYFDTGAGLTGVIPDGATATVAVPASLTVEID